MYLIQNEEGVSHVFHADNWPIARNKITGKKHILGIKMWSLLKTDCYV